MKINIINDPPGYMIRKEFESFWRYRMKLRCPEVERKQVGDESYDLCGLTRFKPCLIEHGLYECEIYNAFINCPHLHTTIIDDKRYCLECGTEVTKKEE